MVNTYLPLTSLTQSLHFGYGSPEIPHEHKCAHIAALDDGNYAAQPNNRCIWDIPSFTVKDNIPDWKLQTSEWNVENTSKWKTEDI